MIREQNDNMGYLLIFTGNITDHQTESKRKTNKHQFLVKKKENMESSGAMM